MCGFAGIVDPGARKSRSELCGAVQAMAETMHHRGPDDAGAWIDETVGVGLGFRRLAIVDLSPAGHQPMVSSSSRLALVFNGEIYNHAALRADVSRTAAGIQWRGHSDTETLLACFGAWGVRGTLERAVGMFALALWDGADRRLHLARDRFGEKPLYYGWTRQGFVFGSELAALRRVPGFDNPIDRDVLALYTQFSCVPAPYSIYQDVYKLEPGCMLSLPLDQAALRPAKAPFAPSRYGGLAVERYWSLPDVAGEGLADPISDETEAADRLADALSESVRLQSIADVPLGAFLSGGIDSSTIVALMQAQSSRRIRTFTIGFEEAGFNEAEDAKAVALHLGTDHTEAYVSAAETRDVIPRLPALYSEPFADSSQVPTHVVSCIARRHVTVALSGDGGDELFGGYTRHLWGPRIWSGLRWVPPLARRTLGALVQRVPISGWDAFAGSVPQGRRLAHVGDKAHKVAHRLGRVATVDDLYRSLVTTWLPDAGVVLDARALPTMFDRTAIGGGVAEAEHRMMMWDAITYLPDDILQKVDRASMGVSLETRAPFLDHRVAQLAWRLPLHMKFRDGKGKWIVRQLLYRYVPPALVERPKMGFGMPIDGWLRGPLREWAEGLLDETKLSAQGYFNPAPVRMKWAEHLAGRRNWQAELWCVLMFQAWLEAQA